MLKKTNLNSIFLFALFGLFFVALIGIFYPFFYIILWASLLYILLSPLHKIFYKKLQQHKRFFKFKKHILAAIFSIATLVLIIGPLLLLSLQLSKQLYLVFKNVEFFLRHNPSFISDSAFAKKIISLLKDFGLESELFSQIENLKIRSFILQSIQHYSNSLLLFSRNVLGNTANFFLSIIFVIFALYFFYVDGAYLFSLLIKAIPINPVHMQTLAKKFSETIRGLLSGYFLVALYQGVVAFILMKIFGINAALLFSVLLMFSSFMPLFGAALVWFPLGIILIITSSWIKGLVFLILSGVLISLADNFLRPIFLKDRIKVHPLIIFFAILGGLKIFGLNGLILGPLVVILFFAVLDMLVSIDEGQHKEKKKQQIKEIETKQNENLETKQ